MPFDLSSLADRISRNCDQQGDYHPPEEECRRKSSRKREETKRWIEDSAREYNPKRKKRKDKTKSHQRRRRVILYQMMKETFVTRILILFAGTIAILIQSDLDKGLNLTMRKSRNCADSLKIATTRMRIWDWTNWH